MCMPRPLTHLDDPPADDEAVGAPGFFLFFGEKTHGTAIRRHR
jgi:hypothetical protein